MAAATTTNSTPQTEPPLRTRRSLSTAGERTLRGLRKALPPNEFAAVEAWISTFFVYQQELLLDWGEFAAFLKSRQIGGSHTLGGAGVLWGLFGDLTTIVSIGQDESDEVLEKVEKHATALSRLGSQWALPKGTKGYRRGNEVRLASGGRIKALPSSTGGRGFTGNVILDEFAYHGADASKIWDGASAVAMHNGYRLRVCSTPNGVGNLFHTIWTDPSAHVGYRLHSTTLDEARADGLSVDDTKCWAMAHGDPRLYDQLFRCAFLDGAEQYIPTELIRDCIDEDPTIDEGVAYAGMDVGLVNDLTAIAVIKQDRYNRCWLQAMETCKRTEWTAQQKIVADTRERWNWRRLCVDATGLGAVPAQLLQQVHGEHKVEAVTFTQQVKEDLATTLYQAFADKMVRIPRDADLITDLCSLKRIITSAGNVRYDADRTSKGHADRAWALALALHACGMSPGPRTEIQT